MKKTIGYITLFTILLVQNSYAQTLYGYVRELNSGNKPVDNVAIKGTLANQVYTTDKGEYTLQFQIGKPGKTVQLFADKEGWVVTDKTKLSPNLPSDPIHNPHTIIVCQKDKWNKLVAQSKDVCEKGMRESYEKRVAELNKNIASLNKANTNYQNCKDSLSNVIDQLTQQYQNQQENISKFAEEHSKQNLDEITELERKAYQLFNEGKIEESLALRESMKSIENIEKRNVENKSLKQTIANNTAANEIDRRNLKQQAKEAQLLFKWEKAEATLEYLAKDTTDNDALFEYGSLLFEEFEIEKSQKYFKYYYQNICEKNVDGEILYDNFRIPNRMLNDDPALIMFILKSHSISEKQEWFDLYSMMNSLQIKELYNILYREKNELNLIKSVYELKEKEKIYSKYYNFLDTVAKILNVDNEKYSDLLIKKNKLVVPFYKISLNSLSAYVNNPIRTTNEKYYLKDTYLAFKNKKIDNYSTDSILNESLKIWEFLSKQDSSYYTTKYIRTFSCLNGFMKPVARLSECKNILQKYEKPEFTPNIDLANVKKQIGDTFLELSKMDSATIYYNASLKDYFMLAKNNNTNVNDDIAAIFDDLETLYLKNEDIEKLLLLYTNILENYENLEKLYPNVYINKIAKILTKYAVCYEYKGDYSTAEHLYKEALEKYRLLAKTNPDVYEPDVAIILHILGVLYYDNQDYSSAKQAYQEALEIRRHLAQTKPDEYELELASTMNALCIVYSKTKQINNCITLGIEELEIRKRHIAESDDAFYNYGSRLGNLAWYQLLLNQPEKAEKAALEALNPPYKNKPANYDKEIEWVNANLALSLLLQGKFEEAKKIYLAFKDKPYVDNTFKKLFLGDLEDMQKNGITHPDFEKIRILLNN